MPFTELFRMTNEKLDATQERASNSSYPSPRPETDFCELVWENGQIMFQGQPSKSKKSVSTTNDYPSIFHNSQDGRDVNGQKMNKFNTMDSILNEMGLEQDVDMMVPWLNYPNGDPLPNDYPCDFLPELSGVTINNISTDNHLAFREKKSGFHGVKHDIPRAGVAGITQNASSQGVNTSSLCEFTNLRLQKLDAGQPSTSSSFTNFPYFSRSSTLSKVNLVNVNTSKRSENDEQSRFLTCSIPTDSTLVTLASTCNQKEIETYSQSVRDHVVEISGSLQRKPAEELLSTKRTIREEGMKDTQQKHEFDAMKGKKGMGDERNIEQVVAASSVCSGNSVDIASNERACHLKRKSLETTESEGPSDEVEDESVGAKKAAHARASSKRSRAAEVHNLSERKRRDRINEKMRALQELIPNCNKVDKASMLDEAIEYLKTLQLQVQMMSMGTGMYMQPMMLPPGMQMPHFSPMGLGMSLGMGFGMNIPFQGPHYPVPGTPSQFHGMPGPSLQPFGHQGPLHQVRGVPSLNMPMGLNVSGVAGSSGASNLDPSITAKDVGQQLILNNALNPATNQATKDDIQPSPSSHDTRQNVNASEFPQAASKTNNGA